MPRFGHCVTVLGALGLMDTAQAPRAVAQETPAVTVSGVVFDSLLFIRAAGAVVEFADAANVAHGIWQATSDHTGRYALVIPPGNYLVRVRSSLLDSLDVEAPVRAVTVGRRSLELPLELPSLGALAHALCGTQPGEDVNGVVVLRISDVPGGAPGGAPGALSGAGGADTASVELEWDSLELSEAGVVRAHHSTRAAAPIGETVRLCGPPPGARVGFRASATGRVTHTSQLRLPPRGVAFQDLTLRAAPRQESPGTVSDARPPAPRTVTVTVTDATGRPLRGAIVRGPGGTGARTDDQGVARVQDVPDGSVDIDVSALGYVPARSTVTPEPPAPDTLTMVLVRTELNPVRVTARRDSTGASELKRRVAFGGAVLTPEDFARSGARTWMDAARTIPGVSVSLSMARRGSFPIRRLEMRSSGGKCVPAIWLNDQRTPVTDNDWDQFIPLDLISRMEIYGSATVPNEYRAPGTACGAVLLWTSTARPKPPPATPPPEPTPASATLR